MKFFFRDASFHDINFYLECFNNEEFLYMLYPSSPMSIGQLQYYITQNNRDFKLICSYVRDDEESLDIGFAHFYFQGEHKYAYLGGLAPKYFNSGYGVYASIASLLLFYDIDSRTMITTGIYKHNLRSLKVHLAIGFTITSETDEKWLLKLTKDGFNNDFVRRIKNKLTYQLTDI